MLLRTAFILLAFTQPALALSCLQPNPLRQYIDARDSTEFYTMAIGRIEPYGPISVPKQDLNSNQTDNTVDTTVRFTGRALTSEGFAVPFQRDITLRIGCLSVWCAGAPDTKADVFVTLRHEQEARLLDIGPCPSNALPWSAEDEARILNCHRFQKCGPDR